MVSTEGEGGKAMFPALYSVLLHAAARRQGLACKRPIPTDTLITNTPSCFTGVTYSYVVDNTKLLNGSPAGGGAYVSPMVHHTLLSGLVPGVEYFYKIDNAQQQVNGTVQGQPFYGSFKVPGGYPLRIAIGADSGTVTNVSVR